MENLTEIANDKLNALFVYDNGALRNRVARRRALAEVKLTLTAIKDAQEKAKK